jgi:hypothetical protein
MSIEVPHSCANRNNSKAIILGGHLAGGELGLWPAARSEIDPSGQIRAATILMLQGVLAPAPESNLLKLIINGCGACIRLIKGLMGESLAKIAYRYIA